MQKTLSAYFNCAMQHTDSVTVSVTHQSRPTLLLTSSNFSVCHHSGLHRYACRNKTHLLMLLCRTPPIILLGSSVRIQSAGVLTPPRTSCAALPAAACCCLTQHMVQTTKPLQLTSYIHRCCTYAQNTGDPSTVLHILLLLPLPFLDGMDRHHLHATATIWRVGNPPPQRTSYRPLRTQRHPQQHPVSAAVWGAGNQPVQRTSNRLMRTQTASTAACCCYHCVGNQPLQRTGHRPLPVAHTNCLAAPCFGCCVASWQSATTGREPATSSCARK